MAARLWTADVEEPPFAQGALQTFASGWSRTGWTRVLLERTVARWCVKGAVTKAGWRSNAVRVAIIARWQREPGGLKTINLLRHAAQSIGEARGEAHRAGEEICRKAGIPLLLCSSIKAGLDIDWSDPRQKATAIGSSSNRVASLERWVEKHLDEAYQRCPLAAVPREPSRRSGIKTSSKPRMQVFAYSAGRRGRSTHLSIKTPRCGTAAEPIEAIDGYKEHVGYDLDIHAPRLCGHAGQPPRADGEAR
jgi:hypothetical protein